MRKNLLAVIAFIVIADLGVGGYLWMGRTVRTRIDKAFASAQQNDAINAITYGSSSVNFFNDTITLSDVRTDLNATPLLASLSSPGRATVQNGGALKIKIKTLTLTGVWSLMLSNAPLITMNGKNITLNGAVTLKSENKDRTIKTDALMSGAVKQILVRGLDLTPQKNAPQGALRLPGAKRYDLRDAVFNFTMTAQNNAKADGSNPALPQKMTVRYAIASASAQDISADFWGYIDANDTTISATFPTNATTPISLSIGQIVMAKTQLVQGTIVKTDYTIKDLRMPKPPMQTPLFNAVLAMLGVDEINADFRFVFDWDLKTRTLSFTKLALGLKQLGRISTDFVLTNIPTLEVIQSLQKRTTPLNKAEAENIFGAVALNRFALEYEDKGVLKKILATLSMQTGGNPDVLAQAYGAQAAAIVSAIYGPAKATEARTKIAAFLKNPTKIRIGFSTTMPLSVGTLAQRFKAQGISTLGAYQLNITN